MIGFSVFLCKEKIAIIKRKREKGHVDLSSSTFEGKKKTENGTKRLIFTAVSILLEIVFLLFLFTKVSEYATIIVWALLPLLLLWLAKRIRFIQPLS